MVLAGKKGRIKEDFTTGKITPQILRFSWPLILSNLLQLAYNYIDMIVIGHFLGSAGLAAVSNGGDVIHLATVICLGFAGAGQVLIAQSLGRRDSEAVSRCIGTLFSFLAIVAVVLTAFGLCFTDWILNIINIPPEAYDGARAYVIVCLWGMIFVFGYNAVSAALRGLGDSIHPFYFIVIASVLNLVLDLVLVVLFDMGTAGAALATTIGESVSFLLSLVFLYRNRTDFLFDFRLRSFRLHKDVFPKLVRLGIPMALQHSAVTFSKLFVTSFINSYGLAYSTVNGIGGKLLKAVQVICNSLGTAATTMVGQCKGAGKPKRIVRIIYLCMGISLVYCALLSGLLVFFPEAFFGIFSTDPDVLRVCHEYVPVLVIFFMLAALRNPFTAFINGMGKAELALVNVIVGSILCRAGLSYLLGEVLGFAYMGFWYGEALSDLVPFLVGGIYFWFGPWKRSLDRPLPEPVQTEK